MLTIYFQGLCAFVPTKTAPGKSEVLTLLLDGRAARVSPRLCRHRPMMLGLTSHLEPLAEPPAHLLSVAPADPPPTALLSGAGNAPRPGLAFWDLDCLDLSILGARPESLTLDSSFENIADIQNGQGFGAVERKFRVANLGQHDLVPTRLLLTEGTISASPLVSGPNDAKWYFLSRNQQPTHGDDPRTFAKEVVYQYQPQAETTATLLLAHRVTGESKRLHLKLPASLTVTSLCSYDGVPAYEELDFLAYYDLLENPPTSPLLPKRERGPISPNSSSCPPARIG